MQKSLLLKFIQENPDWKEILTNNYRITISESNPYVMFKYKINANFNIPLVREARGISAASMAEAASAGVPRLTGTAGISARPPFPQTCTSSGTSLSPSTRHEPMQPRSMLRI